MAVETPKYQGYMQSPDRGWCKSKILRYVKQREREKMHEDSSKKTVVVQQSLS